MAKPDVATKSLDRAELEFLIADVRDAAIILDLAIEAVRRGRMTPENWSFKNADGFNKLLRDENHELLCLTSEIARALDIAKLQVLGTSRVLEDRFHASTGAIE